MFVSVILSAMKKAAAIVTDRTPASQASSKPAEKLHVGRELLDTTWRIAVPVLFLAAVGILGDKVLGSKPWLTLLGAAFGFLVATQLIKRQIMNGPAPTNKPAPKHIIEAFDKEDDD